ncbi:hypothetical protein D3C78_1167960 [compost metagenome]
MLMATTEHVARHEVPLARCDAEPAQRQRLVLRDPLAVEQNLPEQGLGFDLSFSCGNQDGLGRTGRTFVEHRAQALTVEHFLAA